MAGRVLSSPCRQRIRATLALASIIPCDQLVLDQTHRPEEASASDITDIWMTIEVLVQQFPQVLPIVTDVFNEVLFLHDLLYFQCSGAAHRMTLVGVSV